MPMGIVSEDDFEKEIEKSKVVPLSRGRGNSPAVPESLRKIIGENAIEEGSDATKAMTRALGISDSSLSAYKNGATSTSSYHNPQFKNHIDKARERIVKKARNRLIGSLNAITPEKLKEESPRDLAGIAKDMSAIIKNMEPEKSNGELAPRALIIFAPQMMREDKFEVIDVQE
jgi:hypothetical protein